MNTDAAQDMPSTSWRRHSFPIVLAFYLGWLGTLAWTSFSSPGVLTTELRISLTGITLFLGAIFLLIYDSDLTRCVRNLQHGIQHLPRKPRMVCTVALRLGWLAPRARAVRRSVEIGVLILVSVVPALWLISSFI